MTEDDALEEAIERAVDGAKELLGKAVQLDRHGNVRPFDLDRINRHLKKYGLESDGTFCLISKRLTVGWALRRESNPA